MIRVERLRMRLPAGFEGRADSIARLVGKSLSELSPGINEHRDTVSVPPVAVAHSDDNAQIARALGGAVARELSLPRKRDRVA
jgi:hypothetical protein